MIWTASWLLVVLGVLAGAFGGGLMDACERDREVFFIAAAIVAFGVALSLCGWMIRP